MIQVWKYHKVPLLFILLSILFYVSFAYDLQRDDIPKLLALYFGLCVSAYVIIKQSGFNFRLLVIASVIFRLVFILATPNLSQDFYRFIWDGRMILEGFNPYLYTPDSLINAGELPVAQAQDLYNGMGSLSSSHFTNYPPVNQLCFFIAGVFSSKSTLGAAVVLRILIIMADMGTLYFGKKLLERLKIPSTTIFWYILNPFIIIELTGNLHFEGVMIFFLIWSLYLLHSGKWCWAAVLIAVSISVKLIPLMLLPLFFGWFIHRNAKQPLGKRLLNLVTFYSIIGASTLLLFLPFFSMEFINNYSKTVGLWFNSFEFNASFYYLARQIGYWITGYNEIAIIGKILPAISVLFILGFTFFRKNNSLEQLMTSMVLVFSIYLFLSTTVHPWYIATLLILSLFTVYRYPLIWSVAAVLSYLAYTNTDYTENLYLITIEYLVVFAVFIREVFFKKQLKI